MDLGFCEDDICAAILFLFLKGVHTTLTGVHPLEDDGVLGGLGGGVALLDGGVMGSGTQVAPW